MKDVHEIRKDYPMLQTERHGKPLAYLDSAATGQKPRCVIDTLVHFYTNEYAKPDEQNELSKKVTREVQTAREKLAAFLKASDPAEIIFTKGCTESINILADAFIRGVVKENDEIVISAMEHHANIIPWQLACKQTGAKLKVIPVGRAGEIDMKSFRSLLNANTKLISITHSPNALRSLNTSHPRIAKGISFLLQGCDSTKK